MSESIFTNPGVLQAHTVKPATILIGATDALIRVEWSVIAGDIFFLTTWLSRETIISSEL
jgi:hypothetical protein